MKPALILAAFGAAAVAACATPQDSSGDAMAASAERDDLVCRQTEITGSRFSEEICMTEEEFERMDEQGRRTAQEINQRAGRKPYEQRPGG